MQFKKKMQLTLKNVDNVLIIHLFIYVSLVAGSKPMNTQSTIITQAQRLRKQN